MYGIIQNSLKDLVISIDGVEGWLAIVEKAGTADNFDDNERYEDVDIFNLVAAVCEKLNIDAEECLEVFGVHWISVTTNHAHGGLMSVTGKNFREFIGNVNHLHDRLSTAYPGYIAPRFEISDQGEIVEIRYKSLRKGLSPFVKGILKGLGIRFSTNITFIKQVDESTEEMECTLFVIGIE